MLKRYILLVIIVFISLLVIVSFILGNCQWITGIGGGHNVARFFIVVMSLCIPLAYIQSID